MHRLSYRESTVNKVSALFSPSLTADSKESCTSLVACMPVEIFMRQGVSHGFVQMVYYCLDLFLISLQSCLLHFSCEVLLVHVIPALSFIALLSDAMKCLVSAHLTRADF